MWLHLEIPCAVLFFWCQKGYIWTGEGSGKGHKDDQRCGSASPPGITKQNRLEIKWVGVGQRSINHTCVSRGSKLGTMGALCPQGRNRGTAWREEVAGGKQRKGRGSSHNVSLNSALNFASGCCGYQQFQKTARQIHRTKVCRGPLHFTDATSSSGEVKPQIAGWQESSSGKYCSLSPVLILASHPRLTNTRERTLG